MSRRSKVVLVILVVFSIIVLMSLSKNDTSTNQKLENFEEEITDPNNELNPLNNTENSKAFILEFPQKIERFISNIFSKILGFFEGLIGKIFVVEKHAFF